MEDLKQSYSFRMRISLLIALALMILIFVAAPAFTPTPFEFKASTVIELEPPIEAREIALPVEPERDRRPTLPVEAELDEEVEAQTITETVGLEALDRLPPPPESGNTFQFIPHEKEPVPKDVVQAEYPEIPRRAGIEGIVVLHLYIDEGGRVAKAYVARSLESSLDQAALEAAKKTAFYPALQRDRPIGVWAAYRVRFQLRN